MTGGADVLIELRGATKRWDASSGLAPVDLEVRRGELVVIRGRSGSGKSTLLSLVAGWCAPDRGDVVYAPPLRSSDRWSRWEQVAIVPQVLGLAGELSVADNVGLPLRLTGVARAVRRSKVAAILAALDLTEHAERLPRETSLGQQQRAAVARAAIVSPALLLADEPTCHQDPQHSDAVLAILRRTTGAGGGVIIATHDETVAAAADRVLTLD